jgi:hypothetical protein
MMPEITPHYDGSKHKDALEAILPDQWPKLKDGPVVCSPWIASIFDCGDALTAEANARDIKRAIERGSKFWRQWEILWTPEQLESVLKKVDETNQVV